MVGILFVFLLMLTVFALNFRDEEDKQKVAYTQYLEAKKDAEEAKRQAAQAQAEAEQATKRADLAQRQADAAKREAAERRLTNEEMRRLLREAAKTLERNAEEREKLRNHLLLSLQQTLKDRKIEVSIDPNSGILRLSGDLLFEKGDFNLKGNARQTVAILTEVLGKILPCYANGAARLIDCPVDSGPILEALLVEGHTDRQPYQALTANQSQDRNDRLSTDRALTVFRELWQRGAGLDALRNADNFPLLRFQDMVIGGHFLTLRGLQKPNIRRTGE